MSPGAISWKMDQEHLRVEVQGTKHLRELVGRRSRIVARRRFGEAGPRFVVDLFAMQEVASVGSMASLKECSTGLKLHAEALPADYAGPEWVNPAW